MTTTLKRLAGPVAVASTDSPAEHVIYTAGAGVTAIVKLMRFELGPTGTGQAASWGILPSGQGAGTGPRWLAEGMTLNPGEPLAERDTFILMPGDKLIVAMSGTGATVWAFGGEVT